jgi:hypothetical protein
LNKPYHTNKKDIVKGEEKMTKEMVNGKIFKIKDYEWKLLLVFKDEEGNFSHLFETYNMKRKCEERKSYLFWSQIDEEYARKKYPYGRFEKQGKGLKNKL